MYCSNFILNGKRRGYANIVLLIVFSVVHADRLVYDNQTSIPKTGRGPCLMKCGGEWWGGGVRGEYYFKRIYNNVGVFDQNLLTAKRCVTLYAEELISKRELKKLRNKSGSGIKDERMGFQFKCNEVYVYKRT